LEWPEGGRLELCGDRLQDRRRPDVRSGVPADSEGLARGQLYCVGFDSAPAETFALTACFGRSPVEQIVITITTAMRRSFAQLEYFREGNQPDAVFGLPETWSPDKVQQFQDYWDSVYSGNLANRRRMKFIPSGTGSRYTALKEPPLKNEFDEWLVRIVCAAFNYSPSAFVSLSKPFDCRVS